jgi:predicted amidohydrolase YtcJ
LRTLNLRRATAWPAWLLALLPLLGVAEDRAAPDRIYVNAHVWTGDSAQPEAAAFAVRGDRLLAVGADAPVRALAGIGTEIVDLGGRRVVPGFNDAHWHLPARPGARLDNSGSVAVILQRLQAYAAAHQAEKWLVGRGWMPNDFPDLTAHRRYLDAAFPDRPVVIRDRDGHQALANTRALELAGITAATPDPEDGRIEREADGRPTGLLKERAARLVLERLPPMTAADTYVMLLEEMATAASLGLTSLQDATAGGFTEIERAAVDRALAEGTMKVRYRIPVPFSVEVTPEQLAGYVALRDRTRGSLLSHGIAKEIIDGTVDAHTAAMLEPYTGTNERGMPMWPAADLNRAVAIYDRAGLQVQLHAIGDAAIRMALDAFEHAAKVNGPRDRRHRVEHIEAPALTDLPRFKSLGVIASTQPVFATPDANAMQSYAPLLGPGRAARANAFRLFDQAGAVQAFGSDYPVFPMDPLLGIYTAVTRQTPAGEPPGGWHPANRIPVEAALAHYTRDAAFASFEEDLKGTLTSGKYADFVVLSADILWLPPERLLEASVLLTVMGGRETWRAPGFDPAIVAGPERAKADADRRGRAGAASELRVLRQHMRGHAPSSSNSRSQAAT